MIKKRYLAILLLIIVIAVYGFITVNQSVHHEQAVENNTTAITRELIGNDSTGSVEVIKNIGNPNGTRIAYVVGVHPLENDTHQTLLKLLPEMNDLNHCYDIYVINVDLNLSQYGQLYPDDEPGRAEGQDLAYKYVYPAILNGNYSLAIDVHSNVGAYPYQTFVFSPVNEGPGEKFASDVAGNASDISYYSPPSTTSGPYLTIPLNENNIPSFYFEEYSFASQDVKDAHMMQLIGAVDNLQFS